MNIFRSKPFTGRLLLAAAGLAWLTGGQWTIAAAATIQRLDGSTISFADAASFARKTLAEAQVTGAQISVLDRGRLVWSEAFGLRRRDPELPMTRETTTWAASITKSVFATYVMQLVERGEFSLDTPIVTQLSKPLDAYDEYKETASELVRDPDWPSVTPRILLAHTSGLGNLAIFAADKKMRLHFKPGTRYSYSGDGLNLIQLAIEEKKGRPLDQLMQEALFTPLSMTRTGIIYRTEFADNVADRYNADGTFRSQTKRFPARAAGSMTTSADDVARFIAALFAGRIVKPSTRQAMLQPFIQIRSLHQFALAANEPEGSEAARVGLAYGMGWGLLTRTRFGPAFFKEGHGDGAQNYMICFERRQACMIVLTNSDNGELAFRPLLEMIFGDSVTPWEWEGYTPAYIEESRKR